MSLYTYPNGTCQEEEESGYTMYDPFEYETGPNDVPCPDGVSTGCTAYWNSSYYEVIVDKYGRYLKDYLEFEFTYYDDGSFVPLETFATKCGDIEIDAPDDICAEKRSFTPNDLPCKYHLSYFWEDEIGRDNIVHEYGMHTSDTVFYLYEIGFNRNNQSEEFYHGTRSYKRKGSTNNTYMSLYTYPNGTCQEEEEGGYTVYDPFVYETGPNWIICPDGNLTGCEAYWDSSYNYVIVDSQGRYLKDYDGFEFTYYDDGSFVSLDTFATKCGDIEIDAPDDICEDSASSAYVSLILMVLSVIALLF